MTQIAIDVWSHDSCSLCGSTAQIPYAVFESLQFVACGACQLVYKASEDRALRDAEFYEEGYYTHKRNRRLRRFGHRSKKAKGLLCNALCYHPTARNVLDVGCAVGEVIHATQQLGLQGLGCDISKFAVDYCNARGLPAKVGELEALPTPDSSVDIVVLKHVLEHTPTPKKALAEVRRVLRPMGVLVVAVPDLNYWKGRWWRRLGRYFRPNGLGRQHYIYYTDTHLVQLLKSEGFQVRAKSKAIFRRPLQSASRARWWSLAAASELLRFAAVWLWTTVASQLYLRREIVVIATLKS